MTISTTRGSGFRPSFKRLGIAFALASLLGSMAMAPASADGYHGHRGGYSHGYRHGGYGRRDWRGGAYYQPYDVYAPPPVYYPPQPSPGVSLFFPIRIR
jgi:hypothetical protein